jgi:hypothetical protein
MKKIYTSALAFALLASPSFAQTKSMAPTKNEEATKTIKNDLTVKPIIETNKDGMVELWSDDFSDPSTWDIDHDASASSLDWEIGTGLSNGGAAAIDNITSTTASNGFAMVDSDEYGGATGGTEVEDSWFTTATAIDLTGNPNVILEFQSFYRKWTAEECFVVISTNNTDWPELTPTYNAESNDNVFRVWPGMATQAPVVNPTVKRINISAVAGGQSTVWVRFNWTGTWGYSWMVDDVKILEQAANDMVMKYAVISHNSLGDEYGRVPTSQLNDDINLGSLSTNFGYEVQTNISTDVVIEDETATEILSASSDIMASLNPTDTNTFDTNEMLPVLNPGVYTATFNVTSAEEQGGDEFFSNTIVRDFEITTDVYSLDGIGVYSNAIVGSLGTNSFIDFEDGLFIMTLYQLIQEENQVFGFDVLITSTTVPGGSIIAHLMDTVDVLNDNIDNPIVSSDEVVVTQAHVDAGVVTIYFDQAEILAAGSYYAAVELYSNGGENNVRVLNDQTVPQPGNSSLIYTNQTFGNGNASAIRLLMSGPNSINEIEKDAILSQNAPNPAYDYTTVGFELLSNQNVTIRVTDILGKIVLEEKLGNLSPGNHSYTLDLNGLNAGTYHYSIVTNNGSLSKAMQIIK